MGNTRVTLPPHTGRQLRILSEHRETSATTLVIEMIERAYERLGLDDDQDKLWKAPEARS
jgi:hypothetical protein